MFKKTFFPLLLFSFLFGGHLSAQDSQNKQLKILDVKTIEHSYHLPPTHTNAHFFVQASQKLRERIRNKANTTFEIDYFSSCGDEEWPQQAVTAFEYAMAIWGEHVESDVPIKVNANWMDLEGNTLGSARPSRIVQVGNAGQPNTWYTLAQLSALTGTAVREQIEDIDYDIDMNVQCDFDDWYFGTDTNVPENKSDFVTVILHEIGHGIGFLGSMESDSDAQTASWGIPDDNRQPLIYDRFTVDGDFNKLINESVYENPSADLYNALIGDRGGAFFDGVAANNSLIGLEQERARLYTPEPFDEGSSYSHFDQTTFRRSVNALMLPFIDRTFAVHSPGPLFCGVLSDIGWPLGEGCLDLIQSPILVTDSDNLNFGVLNIGETTQLTLLLTNRDDAELPLNGDLDINDEHFTLIGDSDFSLEPGESREITISYSANQPGRNIGVLSISHNASNERDPFTISLNGEALGEDQVVELNQSYPNPFVVSGSQSLGSPVIEYAIARNSRVKLDLYTTAGQLLQPLVDEDQVANRYRVPVDLNGYSSGIYIYRIVVDGVAKSGKLMYVR